MEKSIAFDANARVGSIHHHLKETMEPGTHEKTAISNRFPDIESSPIFSDEKSCSPVRTIRGKDVEKSHRHRSEPAFYFIGLVPSGYLTLFMGFHGIKIHLRGYTFCDLTYSSYESHGGNIMKYIYIYIYYTYMYDT